MEIYRGAKCLTRFTISHFPLKEYYGYFNIHGHLHTYEDLSLYNTIDTEYAKELRANGHYIDVGVDRWEGKPVLLSDILENKTDIQVEKIPQLTSVKWQYKKI